MKNIYLEGLFIGANAFFLEAGEPTMIEMAENKEGFAITMAI